MMIYFFRVKAPLLILSVLNVRTWLNDQRGFGRLSDHMTMSKWLTVETETPGGGRVLVKRHRAPWLSHSQHMCRSWNLNISLVGTFLAGGLSSSGHLQHYPGCRCLKLQPHPPDPGLLAPVQPLSGLGQVFARMLGTSVPG